MATSTVQAVVARTAVFRSFVDAFTKHSSKPDVKRFRLEQGWTIQDVQREANAALDEYNERGTGLRHFFRTVGRDFSNNASAAEVLLEFIPDGDYGSVACGALSLVYGAAKRVKSIRDRVLNCCGSLTRTVEGTKAYMQLYSGDVKLWQLGRTFRALFKQSNYAAAVEEKIKDGLDSRVKGFREHLEYCQHERIQKIHIGVSGIMTEVQGATAGISAVRKNQEELTGLTVRMIQDLARDRDWNFERNKQLSLQNDELRQALLQLANRPLQHQLLIVRNAIIAPDQLSGLLNIDITSLSTDHILAIQHGHALSPMQQSKSAEILRNSRFQNWFKSSRSDFLIVNGNDSQHSLTAKSPLTYFTALFAQTLAENRIAIPLAFFCGTHANPGDPMEGAAGMLRGLIFQLLLHHRHGLDLSFLNYSFIEAIRTGEIRYLCELFRGLIISIATSFGQSAIICVIDGVSFLETDSRRPDLEVVIASLQQLCLDLEGIGGFVVLKFVLTYPNVSRYAWEWFPPHCIITLGQDYLGDGSGYDPSRMRALSSEFLRT